MSDDIDEGENLNHPERRQFASAKVWTEQETDQRTKRHKTPWEKQALQRTDDWVGLKGEWTAPPPPRRSKWNGWLDEEEYRDAYERHAKEKGFQPLVGSYMGAEQAVRTLREAIGKELPQHAKKHPVPTCPVEDKLLVRDPDDNARWGRGSGSWMPRGGCMSDGDWSQHKDPRLGGPHRIELYDERVQLMPLVMNQKPLDAKDQAVIDAIVQDQLDAEVARPWEKEMGLPTAVVSIRVVYQIDPDGNLKPRCITDARYANGVIERGPMCLPTVEGFVRGMKKGEKLAKQDMKGGYHQVSREESSRHLVNFLWHGTLITMLAESFGTRDIPSAFAHYSSTACADAARECPGTIRRAKVYIDDFLTSFDRNATDEQVNEACERWKESLLKKGIVLSKSKCVDPSTECEMLGIIVNSVTLRLTVPKKKSERYLAGLKELASDAAAGRVTTKQAAVALGRLVSVEVAIPHLLLLSRPLMEDLKKGLARAYEEFRTLQDLPELRNESEARSNYEWIDAPMHVSEGTQKSIAYLIDNWTELDGQETQRPKTTLLIATDAADFGLGGTIYKKTVKGLQVLCRFALPMSMEEAASSSTCREALAQLMAVRKLREEFPEELRGAVIESFCDNLGFARRHAMGSTKFDLSTILLELVRELRKSEATWVAAYWLPRERMELYDGQSRERRVPTESLRIDQEWFEGTMMKGLKNGRQRVPNIDGFSTREDKVLRRYVTAKPEQGAELDGARHRWLASDVPWLFPPIALIPKAVQNWSDSASAVAYICVPAVSLKHHWLRGMSTLRPVPRFKGVPVNGIPEDAGHWSFDVYALVKRENPKAEGMS